MLCAEATAVSICLCNISAAAAVRGLANCVHNMDGFIHAAGLLADAALQNQTAEKFGKVWGPKVVGTACLHEACCLVGSDVTKTSVGYLKCAKVH